MSLVIDGYVKSLTALGGLVVITFETEAARCGQPLQVSVPQEEAVNWIPGQAITVTFDKVPQGAAG